MKTKDVWFNQGRWLVRCPVCKQKNQIRPEKGRKTIKWYCGGCYPDKIKRVPKPLPTGAMTYGYSKELQKRAAQQAYNNDEIHVAVLPDDWWHAQQLLRERKKVHQGFYPGDFASPNDKQETVEDLKQENKEDPVLFYLKNRRKLDTKEKKDKGEAVRVAPEKEPISDRFFRSLQ